MPPTFLWATAADVKVPAANTLHMAEALLQAGVPVETHIFEAGEHGLALACPASAGIRRKVEPPGGPVGGPVRGVAEQALCPDTDG